MDGSAKSGDRTSPKTTFCLQNAKICPTAFGATFAAMFVLIYWLREFSLFAIVSR